MKLSLIFILAIVLLTSSCKKDQNNRLAQGQFSFDLNGVHHSFAMVALNSGYAIYDTLGVREKGIGIGSPGTITGNPVFPMAVITIGQTNTLPCSDSLLVGSYNDGALNPACNNSVTSGCIGFGFTYSDTSNAIYGGLATDYTDSSGVLTITSFSMSPNIISGTFKCRVTDNNGNYFPVTNGMFTNVPFFLEQ